MKSDKRKRARRKVTPMVCLARRLWNIGKNTKFRELRKRGIPFQTVTWNDLGPAGQLAWIAVAKEASRIRKANAPRDLRGDSRVTVHADVGPSESEKGESE